MKSENRIKFLLSEFSFMRYNEFKVDQWEPNKDGVSSVPCVIWDQPSDCIKINNHSKHTDVLFPILILVCLKSSSRTRRNHVYCFLFLRLQYKAVAENDVPTRLSSLCWLLFGMLTLNHKTSHRCMELILVSNRLSFVDYSEQNIYAN